MSPPDDALHLVVMAGGSGTRFWPKSTSRTPKQLLAFSKDTPTLLLQTLARFDSIVPRNQKMIVTTQSLEKAVLTQSQGAQVLAEPQGRNTAPCIYWAAREIARRDRAGVMLVMPSDHYIPFPERFAATVRTAAQRAGARNELVTLGVKPTRPETGYGYLKVGPRLDGDGCRVVNAFVEKPGIEQARAFVEQGCYLWNGGMFLWRAEVILDAFDRFMPEMGRAWDSAGGDVRRAYPNMTATSIDYGIMEKATNVVAFELDCGWDDLGSWTSLEGLADVLKARVDGNVVTDGDLIAIQARGNVVDAPGRLVALLGVDDLILVEHGDAVLVARKDRAQDVKLVVEQVKKRRPDLA